MQSRVVLPGSRISQRDELLYSVATSLVQYKPFTFTLTFYIVVKLFTAWDAQVGRLLTM